MLAFDQAGRGVPLVFVHAFPLNRRMWTKNTVKFQRNFRVICVDLPGFGDTPLSSDPPSISNMAFLLLKTLDSLGVTDKAIFTGVSMGGYVLFEILRMAPDRIRAFSLVSTRAGADSPEAREKRFKTMAMVKKEGLKPLAEKMIPNLFGRSSLEANSPAVGEAREMIERANPDGVCSALQAMADRSDSTGLLESISFPTLVVAGEEDSFIPPSEAKVMSERIPKARLEMVGKAGHLLTLEQPDAFNELFSHFLKRSVL